MHLRNALLLTTLLFLTGCATVSYMKLDAYKGEDQEIVYNEGKQTIVSKNRYFVTLSPYSEIIPAGSKTAFILFVYNMGENPITIGSKNVQVAFFSDNYKWNDTRMHVQDYNEMMMEIEENQAYARRSAAWRAFAMALSASSAATSTTSTYSSGNLAGNYNGKISNSASPYTLNTSGNYSGVYSGTTITTTYDPAKAQMLAYQNQQLFNDDLRTIAANYRNEKEFVNSVFMKTHTIAPGASHGGLVFVDTRGMDAEAVGGFEVAVNVDGEFHLFRIVRSYYNTIAQ